MSATYAPATARERRVSLSRGPALILGTILLAAGLYFMYRQHTYPRWGNFPNGGAPVDRHALGIFGINGFTGLLTAIAGGLLLFGAAEHYLAKTMSLIVGVVLGAAAIIALVSGNVLGLAAANGWTELAWGIAAAILLLNALMPAYRRRYGTGEAAVAGAGAGAVAGDVAARHETRRAARAEDPALARGGGTAAAPGTVAPGAAAGGAGAGTGVAPGQDTEPVGNGPDVNYSRRITGGPAAAGEPAGVANGNVAAEGGEPVGAGAGSGSGSGRTGGGPLSRLFGRRNDN